MRFRALPILILILAFFGIADAAYLAGVALSGSELSCDVGGLDGCNVVAQSPYSQIFGIPLGAYGVLFYGILFFLSALYLALPKRVITRILFALGVFGFVVSLYFLYLQYVIIEAFCVYCVTSAVLATLIFLASWMLARRARVFNPQLPL